MYIKINRHALILNMMSRVKQILVYTALSSVLLITSCQKDDDSGFDEDNKTPEAAFTYKASINGTEWKATQNVSLLVKNSAGPGKEMRITANSSDNKRLSLTLSDASTGVAGDGIVVKTYSLKQSGTSDANFSYEANGSNTYEGAYGTVTITSSDAANKKLSGTFSCTLFKGAGDSLKITNGIITDLPYTIFEQ
jgi:hypothetical protein